MKVPPCLSLISERRSGSAELVFGPQRPPEDLLGGDPSLKRSVSADAALSEKSPYLGNAWVRLGPTTRPYQRQRDRAGASLGGDHHHPSRIARKLLLARASSASGGPVPRSAKIRQAERDRAGASLGGDHHHPSRTARKLLLPRAYSASGGPVPRSWFLTPRGRPRTSWVGTHL